MTDETTDATQDKAALIADLNNANTSFRHNEEAGERRVQFFIGLLTAVIAALALLGVEAVRSAAGGKTAGAAKGAAADPAKGAAADPVEGTALEALLTTEGLAAVSMVALVILLAFGALTFLRVVKRDCVTEEYKAISSYRRRLLGMDDPFDVVKQVNETPGSAKRVNPGGLAQLMAGINSILIFALSVLALGLCPAPAGCWPYVTVIGLLIALGAATWQLRFCDRKRKDYRKALEAAFDAAFDAELDKLRDRAATIQRVT